MFVNYNKRRNDWTYITLNVPHATLPEKWIPSLHKTERSHPSSTSSQRNDCKVVRLAEDQVNL